MIRADLGLTDEKEVPGARSVFLPGNGRINSLELQAIEPLEADLASA